MNTYMTYTHIHIYTHTTRTLILHTYIQTLVFLLPFCSSLSSRIPRTFTISTPVLSTSCILYHLIVSQSPTLKHTECPPQYFIFRLTLHASRGAAQLHKNTNGHCCGPGALSASDAFLSRHEKAVQSGDFSESADSVFSLLRDIFRLGSAPPPLPPPPPASFPSATPSCFPTSLPRSSKLGLDQGLVPHATPWGRRVW